MDEDVDAAIDIALGDTLRARRMEELISALRVRRESIRRDLADAPAEQAAKWDKKLAEVERQINVLKQEHAIAEFVERSVRATANRPRTGSDEDEDDE